MQEQRTQLIDFYKEHHRMPTYAEAMKLFGYKSKSAAYYAMHKLVEEGMVIKHRNGQLSPHKLYGEVPLLGYVEAGFPSAAEEELVDTLSLDEYLIANKDATFMLRVKGDSMIDAGIMEGDIVLVERGQQPKVGQIVIAAVDGEYTMKYYRSKKDADGQTFYYLEAANKKYKPIIPKESLQVQAIVQAVIRKY